MISAHRESGNILVYILGAIFLMGILVVMVRGNFQPGSGIDAEKMMIQVSEIQRYGNELEAGIRYIIGNGYSETDIRFAHLNAASAYGLISDDPGRQMFSRDGGGATYREPPENIQTAENPWVFTGANKVENIGTDCPEASCAELLAILPYVTESFCLALNKNAGIENPGGRPPQNAGSSQITTPFTGTYAAASTIRDDNDHLSARREGCYEGNAMPSSGTYHYFRVLLAR